MPTRLRRQLGANPHGLAGQNRAANVYETIERPLVTVLAYIERTGAKIDATANKVSRRLTLMRFVSWSAPGTTRGVPAKAATECRQSRSQMGVRCAARFAQRAQIRP